MEGWFYSLVILLWLLVGFLGWVPFDWLYTIRWYSLAGAFVFGLIFSLWIVLPYPSTGKSLLLDMFLGRLENPQFKEGRIDAKMWLYLIGAVMLELNILSFVAHHYNAFGTISPGLMLGAAMLTYFILDYLSFEKVHLYTYDFFCGTRGHQTRLGLPRILPLLLSDRYLGDCKFYLIQKPLYGCLSVMRFFFYLAGHWLVGQTCKSIFLKPPP